MWLNLSPAWRHCNDNPTTRISDFEPPLLLLLHGE